MGGLAMLFGSAGFMTCLAGLVSIWILNHQIQRPVQEVVDEITELCVRGADGADAIADEIESSRETALEIQDLIQKEIGEVLSLSEEDIAQIKILYADLQNIIQHVRDWIGLAETSLNFIDQLSEIISSTMGYVQADSSVRADLGTALVNGANQVENAAVLLDEVHLHVLSIQAHDKPDLNIKEIESLSSRIDGVLLHLKEQALTFASEILGLKDLIEQIHLRIKRFILLCAIALSILLFWQAVAQAALTVLGWMMIRSKSAALPLSEITDPVPVISLPNLTVPAPSTKTSKKRQQKKKKRKKRH